MTGSHILTTVGDRPDRMRIERLTGIRPGWHMTEGHTMTSTGRRATALPLVARAGHAVMAGASAVSSLAFGTSDVMDMRAMACCRCCMP